ncbi:hypothetical protein [Weissella cibaria]|uniref:hypothetical protein n=1 Tax=Weissella cibaria TaxID=137591 RepID=UPI0022E01A42|nr:hypothetical protein [Weissella cibaria]
MKSISLTQFLTFTGKVSTAAKINAVKTIKYNSSYSPSIDYWKLLRDRVFEVLSTGSDIEQIRTVLSSVSEDSKRANYERDINKLISFFKKRKVQYFDTGSASIKISDDLSLNANPEIGLYIDGTPYLLKMYYKKPEATTKITRQNIQSTLTAMSLAKKNFDAPAEAKIAVLNLQNGKLIEQSDKPSQQEAQLLDVDLQMFDLLWKSV